MAIIKCKECGKEFSNKASFCPNCGCPFNESFLKEKRIFWEDLDYNQRKKLTKEFYKNNRNEKSFIINIIFIIFITLCLLIVVIAPANDNNQPWLVWLVLGLGLIAIIICSIKSIKNSFDFKKWLLIKYNIYK